MEIDLKRILSVRRSAPLSRQVKIPYTGPNTLISAGIGETCVWTAKIFT